ncbi:hypothetical protein ACQV2X_05450 [Facklamia sp. P12945]|uniref:hypothetical protein n=1 Tax=unclassified Facklamia TaxID=2622293 RepID=UPI003D1844EE
MAEPKLILTKEKEAKATKPIFIDVELLDGIKELKQETGISIQRIAEKFIKYGIENVEIEEVD